MGAIMMERAKMMERFTFAADFVPLELSCGKFKFMSKNCAISKEYMKKSISFFKN